MDIWDLFREEEERLLEQERPAIAAEMAAWRALPKAEQDRISAEREAKLAAMFDAAGPDDEDEEDEEDEEDGE